MADLLKQLVASLEGELVAQSYLPEATLVRISQGEDLARVLAYGTTRAGRSDMQWDKLHLFAPSELPRYPLRHDEVLIASTFDDLLRDVSTPGGTLADKLDRYTAPFFTLYRRDAFIELMSENTGADMRNQGRHYLFTIAQRIHALLGVLHIQGDPETGYYLTRQELGAG